jgi:hypothetical protein
MEEMEGRKCEEIGDGLFAGDGAGPIIKNEKT